MDSIETSPIIDKLGYEHRRYSINGRVFKARLEPAEWAAFEQMCHATGATYEDIIEEAEKRQTIYSLESELRVMLVDYYLPEWRGHLQEPLTSTT